MLEGWPQHWTASAPCRCSYASSGESFTLAAHQLGLSRALVSRHARDLETRLGARLLSRSMRALDATEKGRQHLEFCEADVLDIESKKELAQSTTDLFTRTTRSQEPIARAFA